MDSEDSDLETKCEHVMNVVVETRKRYGKMCFDYEQKASLMENRLLNLQVDTFSKCKFKTKNVTPFENQDSTDMEDISVAMTEKFKRIESLMGKLKNIEEVVAQLKSDGIGRRLLEPLAADAILAKIKSEKNDC